MEKSLLARALSGIQPVAVPKRLDYQQVLQILPFRVSLFRYLKAACKTPLPPKARAEVQGVDNIMRMMLWQPQCQLRLCFGRRGPAPQAR